MAVDEHMDMTRKILCSSDVTSKGSCDGEATHADSIGLGLRGSVGIGPAHRSLCGSNRPENDDQPIIQSIESELAAPSR